MEIFMKFTLKGEKNILYFRVNMMTADDLVTQGARTSAVMALTQFYQNITALAPQGLIISIEKQSIVWVHPPI